jgi:hypothetical protein
MGIVDVFSHSCQLIRLKRTREMSLALVRDSPTIATIRQDLAEMKQMLREILVLQEAMMQQRRLPAPAVRSNAKRRAPRSIAHT